MRLILLLSLLIAPVLSAGETLRLLSYNLHHCEGMDGKIDIPRIAGLILAEKPDIVFLQEIDRNCSRTGNVDQPAELARLTGMTAIFAEFMPFQGGQYGQCLLTRLPVISSKTILLPAGSEPRSSASASIRTTAGPVTVACVHFYETGAQRMAQAQALSAALPADAPVIMMGDFNSEPSSDVMKWLASSFTLPEKRGTQKATWPADAPREEIDHILFRPASRWKVKEYRVLEEMVISDHRPVLCVLETSN